MSFEIVKAGWLFRQSSILKRWKRNWFTLYQDGNLKYFESQDSHVAEECRLITTDLVLLRTGFQVSSDISPPEGGYGKTSMFSLKFRDSTTWNLCAESPDDMSAWQVSLEQARVINQNRSNTIIADQPPPYTAHTQTVVTQGPYQTTYPVQATYPAQQVQYLYPGQTVYGSHMPTHGTVIQTGPYQGQTIIVRDGQYYRRGYDGTDVALGLMAGAALGSMMWAPMLWW